MKSDIVVVLHDVSSVQRLLDTARVVYGLGIKVMVATKVYGAAATNGIPEATKLALRSNASFMVLPSLRDAVELLSPSIVYVVSYEYGEQIDPNELARNHSGRIMIILGGSEAAPTRDDANIGKPIYPRGIAKRIGPVGEAAILLYAFTRQSVGETS